MITDYIKDAAENTERAINSFTAREDTEYFVGEMLNLHRTLNQSFTSKIVVRFIQKMAENYRNGRYDGRNEAACKACSVMWEALKDAYNMDDDMDFNLPCV